MLEIIGTIDKQDIGVGAWVLNTPDGKVYEVKNLPADCKHPGTRVKVTGTLREDMMSIAMVGAIFDVTHCEKL